MREHRTTAHPHAVRHRILASAAPVTTPDTATQRSTAACVLALVEAAIGTSGCSPD